MKIPPLFSRSPLFLLAGLYPTLYFLSNNWFMFGTPEIAELVIAVSLFGLGCWLVLSVFAPGVLSLAMRGEGPASKVKPISDCLHASFALALCGALFSNLRGSFAGWAALTALILVAVWYAYRNGLGRITLFLLALTVLVLGRWGLSSYEVHERLNSDSWHNARKATNQSIEFTEKPNVYFFIADGYPNRAALRDIFDIDNEPFYADLEGLGFDLHHDAFSNYFSTLTSLASIFSMEHHYYSISIGKLDSYSARDLIGARAYNAVVDVFERNGYAIQFIHDHDEQLRKGAEIDYYWPTGSRFAALESFVFGEGDARAPGRIGRQDLVEFKKNLYSRIDLAADSSRPYFTYLYSFLPAHSPFILPYISKADGLSMLDDFRRAYSKDIAAANRIILEIVERIVQRDPAAVILLAADHGAWGHRTGFAPDGAPLPASTITLDRLGILMASRFPDDRSEEATRGLTTAVNLFRYVFAYLAADDSMLAARAADDGFLVIDGPKMGIRDGKLLDAFVEIEPETRMESGSGSY